MSRKIKLSLAVMVFGTFFGLLCSTLMNTALPTLMRVYHIDITQVQWVTNSYMLVNALMIPFSAYLIKRYPFRPLFLLAATIFLGGHRLGHLRAKLRRPVVGPHHSGVGNRDDDAPGQRPWP